MLTLWRAGGLASLLIASTSASQEVKMPNEERIKNRIAFVSNSEKEYGTGCIVDDEHIVTAGHVLGSVVYVNGVKAEVVRTSPRPDITILDPQGENQINRLTFADPKIGEYVWWMGFGCSHIKDTEQITECGGLHFYAGTVLETDDETVSLIDVEVDGQLLNLPEELRGTSGTCGWNADNEAVGIMSFSYIKNMRWLVVLVRGKLVKRFLGW